MKTKIRIVSFLMAILTICFPTAVYAESWENFTDISGHWAEAALKTGYEDGLITGVSSTSIAPDDPITGAQIVTILCRVLGAEEISYVSELGISPDVWYYEAAGKALYLGLISGDTDNLDKAMTRQDALAMTAKAFCLIPAEPDYSVLSAFSDEALISEENKGAMAALVSEKLVSGSGSSLNVNGSITRAEFLAVLFRIAKNFVSPDTLASSAEGGSVLKGSGSLNYINAGSIWFDCSSEKVSLSGVTADSVTLRGHKLSQLTVNNNSKISKLIIAVGTGSVSVGSSGNSKTGVLRLETCDAASVGTDAESVEITGSGIPVSISGKHDSLVISGNGNKVTLSQDAALSRIKVTGDNNSIGVEDGGSGILSCGALNVGGSGNTLSFSASSAALSDLVVNGNSNKIGSEFGGVTSLSVEGYKNELTLSSLSSVGSCSLSGRECKIKISAVSAMPISVGGSLNIIDINCAGGITDAEVPGNSNWITLSCPDISSLNISGNYNTINKLGEGTVASTSIPGSGNAFTLYDGNAVQSADIDGATNKITINGTAQSIILDGQKNELCGSGKVQNLTINALGSTVSLAAESVTDNSKKQEEERVLVLVTTGYNGNYTLKWAQENDYADADKEIWVDAKGYSSSTDYLIWVSLSTQRVNIFKGSSGSWALCYSCIVGTGAPGRGTPVGTWKITYKLLAGWTTENYTVKPVVGFKQDTGYAFHSRLYYPGTSTISDASIGYPVSHGCVRMYDIDVKYIYDSIPIGTTVVVY